MMKPDSHGQSRLAEIVQPPAGGPAPQPRPLAVAADLVMRLAAAGIRYGVYKNRAAVASGLAGANDLDLLVATGDVARFEAVLNQFKAVRGQSHPLHDNAVAGRSQWFVPDFSSGNYLHLDVVVGLRVGPRFAKHCLALDFDDVREWEHAGAPLPPVPLVSRHEEARIGLLRAVHGLPLWRHADWVAVDAELARLLVAALAGRESAALHYRIGLREVACKVRARGGAVEVERRAARALLDLVRGHERVSPRGLWGDLALHHARRLAYLAARLLGAALPLAPVRKVALPGGILIALVGPDGVGKSTQSDRLRNIFARKFQCTTVYLGSGDGGWAPRRLVRRGVEKWRALGHDAAARRPSTLAGALWGIVTALERYLTLRKARRAVAHGLIVITDRWPQNLRPGLLDGPRRPPPGSAGVAGFLSRIERALYRRMAGVRPTAMIHLVSTFEASNARKPGDIDQPAFERRLDLMRALRDLDPTIKTVDAGAAADEVTRALFRIAWLALWRAAATDPPRLPRHFAAHSVKSPA